MANFFISYDLIPPGQHYDKVQEAIKQCGNWAKIEYSLFYVSSQHTLVDITAHVWKAMDSNDKLIVIDTTHNSAETRNVSQEVVQYMRDHWNN